MGAGLPANVAFFLLIGMCLSNCTEIDPLLAAYCQVQCLNQSTYDSDCAFPCDTNITSQDDCPVFCLDKSSSCLSSCHFLWNLQSKCESVECIGLGRKNGHNINNMNIREMQNGRGIVHISWPHKTENMTIYVVQTRWNLILADNFTNWETLTKTTASTIILKEVLYPGRWYQFRIAPVSINGTDGFSDESAPFILSVSPKAPGPPTNLREETEENQYPTVKWEPPLSDLPIESYRVMWVQRSPIHRKKHTPLKESHRLLPPNRLSVTLKQVEPKALFLVQVQAVCRFRNHTLIGEKASIFVNTLKLSDSITLNGKISNLTIFKPSIMQSNDFTKANISWSWPQELHKQAIKFVVRWTVDFCKDKKIIKKDAFYHSAETEISFFTIPNLLNGCKYKVSVQPIRRGHPGEISTSHFTVPCHSLCDFSSNEASFLCVNVSYLIISYMFILPLIQT